MVNFQGLGNQLFNSLVVRDRISHDKVNLCPEVLPSHVTTGGKNGQEGQLQLGYVLSGLPGNGEGGERVVLSSS